VVSCWSVQICKRSIHPLSTICRYVKSRSDAQLRGATAKSLSDCSPQQYLDGDTSKDVDPCGLVAWSYFNDTFTVCAAHLLSISM
jgi:LEM3 (ligand-effect modulator 3) family / CDC50 family